MHETPENFEHKKIEEHQTLERIDGSYIWSEISSILNFDKGIFYTIRELFLRPGKAIQEFLLHDRKRLIKPIIFVIFSSVVFIIAQQLLGFNTGSAPASIKSVGIKKAFQWVSDNFGIVNIILGLFIGFWIRLFFYKSGYNIYEIFILVFFTIGMGNLVFTFFGIIESVTGWQVNNLAYLFALLYSAWAIGNFFNKSKAWSYIKGILTYALGTTMGSCLTVLAGIIIDIVNRNS